MADKEEEWKKDYIHTKEEILAYISLPPELLKFIEPWVDGYVVRLGEEGINPRDLSLNLLRVLPIAISGYLKEVVEEIKLLKET